MAYLHHSYLPICSISRSLANMQHIKIAAVHNGYHLDTLPNDRRTHQHIVNPKYPGFSHASSFVLPAGGSGGNDHELDHEAPARPH
jgi:hypothetical protein